MKFALSFLVSISTFICFNVFAADEICKLEKVIDIKGYSFYDYRLDFKDVSLYETPQFPDQSYYSPKSDSIEMQIFNIEANGILTNAIGAHVSGERGGLFTSLGLPNGYRGNVPSLSTQVVPTEEGQMSTTVVKKYFIDEHNNKHNADEKVQIIFEQNKIIGVKMIVPIEKYNQVTDTTGPTGQFQEICVKSANLSGALRYSSYDYVDL